MQPTQRDKASSQKETERESSRERARRAREAAARDEVLQEQSKTEIEERPYLDTEGAE